MSKKADELSFSEFDKDRVLLTYQPSSHMFGLTPEDIKCIENAFFKAEPNSDPSAFPDFVFDSGFIEHFEISSSEISTCGSLHKKAFSAYEKEVDRDTKAFMQDMNEHPVLGEIKSVSKVFVDKNSHRHEYLLESLKATLDKHISSLNKYQGSQKTKIFLIEYSENMLHMLINYDFVKENRTYGDLLSNARYAYRISRDSQALSLIYERRKNVDYIVFCTDYYFEIIGVADIPEILKLLTYPYEVHSVPMNIISVTYGTSIPVATEDEADCEE